MTLRVTSLLLAGSIGLALVACRSASDNKTGQTNTTPSPVVSFTPASFSHFTLPVLDALLHDPAFVAELQKSLQLSSEQVDSLKRVAGTEVSRLREANAEESEGDATEARERASQEITAVLGQEKATQLAKFVSDYWSGGTAGEGGMGREGAALITVKPNSVPADTRVVVNIPAFRMDVFQDGSLVKSYKIGIGYPQFPLPQGLRKAQSIIVNPTWTPPDEPWVSKLKVRPGETIQPGSKLNPLGPVKIPIGLPSLIHGGKAPAKIGTFASHGCVGLTNSQVKDFAKLLARITDTQIADQTLEKYLRDRNTTRNLKLNQAVPVELRYETIVVEDGRLRIYKDVYKSDTNNEQNLKDVLEVHGVRFDDLSEPDKNRLLYALNAMSARPKQMPSPSPSPTASDDSNANTSAATSSRGAKARPQIEIVVELAALAGKGYPTPVNLDTGTGK